MLPPLIALEEHFFSTRAPDSLKASYSEQFKHVDSVYAKLTDMGQLRRQDMDAGGVSLQVISHVPGLCSYDASACRAANDQLFSAIQAEERRAASSQKEDASDGATDRPGRKPPSSRFAGFAVLPMQQPDEAAAELRRAVTELGFVGALIDNHCGGGNRFYDGAEYESTFWAAAEELGVPVYLHPTWPGDDDSATARFRGNFSEAAAVSLGSSGFGWHADTALHVLRLFASGLFDRRPRLKVIIGHMGEMLPFMLQRIEALSRRWGDFQRDFRTVYDENIWITTSGVWSLDPMRCILANTKIDHILYSVDYPFQKNEIGLEWVRELQESGLVGDEQLRAIAYENAEKPFGGFSG
ncbi:amidohydrolase 2 [Canariomyces notabilis]|uniref:Amidohydrolase 2 n=1 Tax=Canariomyces notabilis TaxID=2074819 RepID=A0AAN6QDU3_9PEZI|nr:amidohydrolase 2 [Canariomyces arenarius]